MLRIAVLGGTGPQGRGLTRRWAQAGFEVTVGSRDAEQAEAAAEEVRMLLPGARARGATNQRAAEHADVVAVVVPWAAHRSTLTALGEQLRGKLVIDCVNPLAFDRHGAYALPVEEGSATQQAAALLPESRVVGAFHNVSAVVLADIEKPVDCDVLVLGDRKQDTDIVQGLADAIFGARGVYAGRLRNSAQVEALTANLISMNRRYKTHSGISVTGMRDAEAPESSSIPT
ncbi:NADPH-dependent F420 reductase [Leucobacter weissii]|uniref:NADPH-dependent F420 reductase n=1 Tax=Leucobacter weissii TaxID=1983706 RepID=A0A939S7W7_9MICO|nr:NADPH-dependent F420 reductase [Leucobacter weissii]